MAKISVNKFGEVLLQSGNEVHHTGWALCSSDGGFMGQTRSRTRAWINRDLVMNLEGRALVKARFFEPKGGFPIWGVEIIGPVVPLPFGDDWHMTNERFQELTGWQLPETVAA